MNAQLLPDYITQGEARAAESLVRALVGAGYLVSVDDGAEWTVRQSRDAETIARALATTGADRLAVYLDEGAEHSESGRSTARRVGTVLLVWGNAGDGSELVSDYSWDDRHEPGRDFYRFMRTHTGY